MLNCFIKNLVETEISQITLVWPFVIVFLEFGSDSFYMSQVCKKCASQRFVV